jgi:hypothetical protein
MQKLKVEKRGCWGVIDGVFQEMPVGHEFTAVSIPPAFAGRVSVIEEPLEQVFEASTPEVDIPAEPEPEPEPELSDKKKKGK